MRSPASLHVITIEKVAGRFILRKLLILHQKSVKRLNSGLLFDRKIMLLTHFFTPKDKMTLLDVF